MNYRCVIDAYARVQHFRASRPGELAKRYIESEDSATPTTVIPEVSRKLLSEVELGNETLEGRLKRLEFIRATTPVVNLDFDTAAKAGDIDLQLRKKRKG